jgi:hypothetical protein
MARTQGFIQDTQTLISNTLQFADAWSALQQEYAAMQTNGIQIVQADLDAVFGANALTPAQYQAALVAQQALVDSIHVQATAAKLYRLKK